jgi:23S rRNA G2445 N2-methylase RlmL
MDRGQQTQSYVATTALGLEGMLAAELESLGAADIQTWGGGARFRGDRQLMIRACLWLRTAHRVRWILGHATARDADDLYRSVRRMARWKGLVPATHTLRIDATARDSSFKDSRFVALRAKDAIVDSVRDDTGDRPNIDLEDPDVGVHIRVVGERLTVSMDASGGSLHARGYRTVSGPAPLRETLAAAVLAFAGWKGECPLYDPMCGSGTLLIEGAWIAGRRAPNLDRRFGFERWPGFRADRLATLRHAAAQEEIEVEVAIAGSDRDGRTLSAARANAARAGVDKLITINTELGLDPTHGPGLLVVNPPYGARLGDEREALRAYRAIGTLLKTTFPGWRAAVLVGNDEQLAALDHPIEARHAMKNGPLDISCAILSAAGATSTPGRR